MNFPPGDPKTARDCLAHCLDVLTDDEVTLAVSLIELYAALRHQDGMNEAKAIFDRVYNEPLRG
jgi:hypothetical protein